jgi:acetyl-CoA carboxylase carboxyltransferase component
MGAKGAVEIIFRQDIGDQGQDRSERTAEYEDALRQSVRGGDPRASSMK